MSPTTLAQAQQARHQRGEEQLFARIDDLADQLCDQLQLDTNVPNYQLVGPKSRQKLKGLIDHYRKMAHPFTACVRDNTKRFGADRAKKVCAVLTDLEKGTTKWRSGGKKMHASAFAEASCPLDQIDMETFGLLEAIADIDYKPLLGLEA